MKKFLLTLTLIFGFANLVFASNDDILSLPYKNIKEESKIKLVEDSWTDNVSRKDVDYLIKFTSDGTGNYSEFYNSDGSFAFTTGCQYEFIHNGDLVGYSNQDLKFYDFTFVDGILHKTELSLEAVKALFPDFEVILVSSFSEHTNSLKVKKDRLNYKILLLNDTDKNFYHYSFTSGNAKFKKYPLTGFLNITKKGMIQFSHFGENTQDNPWFILLVR